jgi:hypothetical protein
MDRGGRALDGAATVVVTSSARQAVVDSRARDIDCPDVSMVSAKRTITITAIQALTQMNNPFILKQAERLAGRIRAKRSGKSLPPHIEYK